MMVADANKTHRLWYLTRVIGYDEKTSQGLIEG